ncbi:helix-turn-helix domain-containing protein [Streptomyces ardesiacus]|uniref:helix-turn-helix domain-containing protein n=1 Tax=Streptomyces ardesiacus TaxID=285564 RepID=UPI0036E5C344
MTTAPANPAPTPGAGPTLDLDDYLADIGDRIRAERQARGWTQTELGRRAHMGLAMVKRLETGDIPLRILLRACHALKVDADHLLSTTWTLPARRPSLSPRQAEVLSAVADGRPLSVAARGLGMTPEGLASVLSVVYRRLGVADVSRSERRRAAVRVAVDNGLLNAA